MFELPDLPYGYGALGAVISEAALQVHHQKHHARYVEVTNDLLAESGAAYRPLEDVVSLAAKRGARKLFNNAGQAWNHGFFWESMDPAGRPPEGDLALAIDRQFLGLEDLRAAFVAEGSSHFGSGWVWLVAEGEVLRVVSTHDAVSPLGEAGKTPLLVCDLWEHAYYLDHKNDRAVFLTTWFDMLANWSFAGRQFAAARGLGEPWRYPRPTELALA
jgi:Fe-Mn family superoxide dismutase